MAWRALVADGINEISGSYANCMMLSSLYPVREADDSLVQLKN